MEIMETRKCRLKILSPVHIGCGEVYEPFSFIVDSAKKELLILDMENFVTSLIPKDREEFSHICMAGTIDSLLQLYKFLRRMGDNKILISSQKVVKKRLSIAKGFPEHYKEALRDGQKSNTECIIRDFTIHRTYFDVNKDVPLIPGSSLKGAIRTALLNLRKGKVQGQNANNYKNQRGRYEARRLEQGILGYREFHQDPLRCLKVSDLIPVGETTKKIVYCINVHKKPGKTAQGFYQIVEVIMPGSEFEGALTLLKAEISRNISDHLSFGELEKALKSFYSTEFKREQQEVQSLRVTLPSFSQKALLVRIGKHSGAECVTIEGFRAIGKNCEKGASTTWFATEDRKNPLGAMVFGWAELVFQQ